VRIHRAVTLAVALVILAASCASSGSDESVTTDVVDTAATSSTTEAPVLDTTVADVDQSEDVVSTEGEQELETTNLAEPEISELPDGYEGYVSATYTDDANWICRPGKADDVCARDLDATIVYADGTTEFEEFALASDPPVDCFYVYPTVSGDPGASSDLIPAENEEISTTLNQAARLGASCRVFAPTYRQRTLTALLGQVESDESTRTIAYDDVAESFKHFLANDSDGRPFVLIGHSQGAGLLRELIAQEVDGEPALSDRLVSAILLGTSVEPDEYDTVPACATASDIGCVVSCSSYRDTEPPPPDAIFGSTDDGPALCVNPADPAGAAAVTSPYFKMEAALLGGGTQPFDDPSRAVEVTTPFVKYPDMVTAECVVDGAFGYLQLTITTEPGPRTDDVAGDLSPEWGMHLIDANVAMGDLVNLVASQAASLS
jgi:hypothetical protein